MMESLVNQKMLIDASPVGMAVYKKLNWEAGEPVFLQLLQANQAFCDALGLNKTEQDEHLKATIGLQGGKRTDWLSLVTAMLKDNPSQTVRFMVKETGRWCRMHLVQKEQNLLLVYLTDEAENIKRQLEFQAAILDQIEDHVTVSDANGVIRYVNQTQCDAFGVSKEAFVGKSVDFFRVGNDDSDQVIAESVRQVIEQGYWEGEIIFTRKFSSHLSKWICPSQNGLEARGWDCQS